MKSAGGRVQINGTRLRARRSELGVPNAVSPSVAITSRRASPSRCRDAPRLFRSGRTGPVTVSGPDERPDDPRHTIGQRDGDDLHRLALQHAPEPVRARLAGSPCADLRHRPEIGQSPKIPVARLGDPAEPLFASTRMGPRGEAEPGRIIPSRPEGLHLRRGRGEGAGRELADPGDRRQPPGEWILLLGGRDPVGNLLDPVPGLAELFGQEIQSRARYGGRLLDQGKQAICVVDAPGTDQSELGKVGPDRVHQLGLLANQEVPGLVVDQGPLALGRLHRDELNSPVYRGRLLR